MPTDPVVSRPAPTDTADPTAVNLVVLGGRVMLAPRHVALPNGDQRWSLDLAVPGVDGRRSSVPLVCHGPSPLADAVAALAAGDEVVIRGAVHRRFFRAGGTTQSRTEVVVTELADARARRRVRALRDRVVAALAALPSADHERRAARTRPHR